MHRGIPSATPQQRRALLISILLLFALTVGMGVLVGRGLSNGEVPLPMKRAYNRRAVVRTQEPAMFWVSLGIYAAVGIGALGLGGWMVREGRALR